MAVVLLAEIDTLICCRSSHGCAHIWFNEQVLFEE